ncbi:spore coat protein [Clostridium sp. P21]|uniref:Spore coat protein n=1 Tax=Clostridium muellerianum TaxID=2716538 RepID=A0A7Y0EDW1_9CLOT|nr:spore coat protein [Clostridium muellerianum]
MYYENVTESFIKYLESKGIYCVESFSNRIKYKDVNDDMIKNQVYIISEFHRKTLGYTGYMNKRLSNNIGRVVEQYKVNIKRLNKDLKRIHQNGVDNKFEKVLLKSGEFYIDRAQKCIESIYKNDYIGLIMRSTKRIEMCIGNTYFNNLRKSESIEVKDIEGCCYNMVEMDLAYLLSKMKRKGLEIDFNSLTNEFCTLENLDQNSSKFILAIISYPYAFMKWCNRYRDKSQEFNEEEYFLKLKKAMKEDGNSLI